MGNTGVPVVGVEVAAIAVDLPSLSERIEWFEDWEESTAKARELSRRDRDYYDGHQWTRDELAILRDRGQPPIVKNRIARKINFILGEEISKRVDPVARPRTPQHEDAARAITDALRYVEEEQKFDKVRSAVAKDMLVEGTGGAVKEYDAERGKHVLRHVQWDRLFWDPHSRELDYADAKFLGVVVWMDLDDAALAYPHAAEELRAALHHDVGESGDSTDDVPRKWADRKRKRIKLVEMYCRIGEDWFRSVFTRGADIAPPERTAYLDEQGQHSLCPLLMASCYIDQEGSRYGIVRHLISPQDELNKRASKSLHLLSVRQVIAERDLVRSPQEFQQELAKPDGFAEVEPNALSEGRIQISATGDMTQGHVAMMQEARSDIDSIGPSASTMPDLPQSASGRAFLARQKAASQELGQVWDVLRSWTLSVFALDWCCIRQFWTEEKWLRVTDDQELTGYRFVALNRRMTRAERLQELLQKQPAPPLPKAIEIAAGAYASVVISAAQAQQSVLAQSAQAQGAQQPQPDMLALVLQHPLMQQPIVANQVDRLLMDIVLDEAPDTAVIEQEEFDSLSEIAPTIVQGRPDMAPLMTKLIVKASQLRNKRELIQELDKAPDPQQQQAQQMMQQLQQQMAQLQAALLQAQVAKTQSEAAENQANAAKLQAEAQTTVPRVITEAKRDEALAMKHASEAGYNSGAPVAPMPGTPQ